MRQMSVKYVNNNNLTSTPFPVKTDTVLIAHSVLVYKRIMDVYVVDSQFAKFMLCLR